MFTLFIYFLVFINLVILCIFIYRHSRTTRKNVEYREAIDLWFRLWKTELAKMATDHELITQRNVWPVVGLDGYYYLSNFYHEVDNEDKIALKISQWAVYYNPTLKDFFIIDRPDREGPDAINFDRKLTDFSDDFINEVHSRFINSPIYHTEIDNMDHYLKELINQVTVRFQSEQKTSSPDCLRGGISEMDQSVLRANAIR